MGKTNIEWADYTLNPWEGCTKVSPGCANCYAEARNHRFGMDNWGKGNPRRRTSAANWKLPLKWNNSGLWCDTCNGQRGVCGVVNHHFRRPRVFCASIADWLDEEVPIEWLADLLKLIHDTPNLDWLLPSKWPENFKSRLIDATGLMNWSNERLGYRVGAWAHGERLFQNVFVGTTCENQEMADKRIPDLLKIPAKVRFLSMEPLLGEVNLSGVRDKKTHATRGSYLSQTLCADSNGTLYERPGIDWVITGSESGRNRRPANTDWFLSLKDQCRAAGVAFFVKQMEIDGKVTGDISKFPQELKVREFPNQNL